MELDQNSGGSSLISVIELSENEAENIIIENVQREEKRGNMVELKSAFRAVRNWRKCMACGEKKKS